MGDINYNDIPQSQHRAINNLILDAEDLKGIVMWLDKEFVPIEDINGKKLSVIGRIIEYGKMCGSISDIQETI